MRTQIGAVLVLAAFTALAAAEGPGTFFTPKAGEGNLVAEVKNAASSVRRTVAFLGGSITEMNGFRPRVMKLLREKYPAVEFAEIAAGLSSTCSDTGAFRLEEDVLAKGVPDVFIVESAVNDDQDGHFDYVHCIRGLEGAVRRVLAANPACEVLVGLMANRRQYELALKGEDTIPYKAGKAVAAHYGAGLVDVGGSLAASAKAGGISWKEYRDCHPSPEGCDFVADLVMKELEKLSYNPMAAPAKKPLRAPIDPLSYACGRTIPFASIERDAGWNCSRPDWKAVEGAKRGYFLNDPILWTETPGAVAKFEFSGTALGFFLTAGPDAGALEVSIDGGEFKKFSLFRNIGTLHYPYTLMVADELEDKKHQVVIRSAAEERKGAACPAVRIHRVVVNGAGAAQPALGR